MKKRYMLIVVAVIMTAILVLGACGSNAGPKAPSAPQNFAAAPGDCQAELSWTAPADDGGSAVTKYEVSKDNGSNWVTASSNTAHTFT